MFIICRQLHIDGILTKWPYLPCLCMADRALLAGYHRYMISCRFSKFSRAFITDYISQSGIQGFLWFFVSMFVPWSLHSNEVIDLFSFSFLSWILVNTGSGNDLVPDDTMLSSEPMLTYCQSDPWKHFSMKISLKYIYFHQRICT